MKPQTNFGELQSLIYNVVKDCIENKKYYVKLKEDYSSDVEGYIEGFVTIAGTDIHVSFHCNGFCCWHVGNELRPIFSLVEKREEQDIVKEAYALKETFKDRNNALIKEYEARIASLKQTI